MSTIGNAKNIPLNVKTGTVPDVEGSFRDWFQPMSFITVTKSVVNFQEVETEALVNFEGVIQPFTETQLYLRPEGQRAWIWVTVHADPVLTLEVDDIIIYESISYRVMSRKDYADYGYMSYDLVQDWTTGLPRITCENGDDLLTENNDYLTIEAAA